MPLGSFEAFADFLFQSHPEVLFLQSAREGPLVSNHVAWKAPYIPHIPLFLRAESDCCHLVVFILFFSRQYNQDYIMRKLPNPLSIFI